MPSSESRALEMAIGQSLRQRGLRLAVAESCTGGLVCDRITNVPGSSDYLAGGVVAYSNTVKESVLGVRHSTLARFGAVSEQTAREMASGARRLLGADVGLAVTGIAGPGGGSPDKPVGLVYVALSAPDGEWVRREVWHGDRRENKKASASAVLDLLLEYMQRPVP
jgi:PncC family amidohydrolase